MNRIALIVALTICAAANAADPPNDVLYCADTVWNRDGTVTCIGPEDGWCCDPSTGDCKTTDLVCPSNLVSVWCASGETPVFDPDTRTWSCK